MGLVTAYPCERKGPLLLRDFQEAKVTFCCRQISKCVSVVAVDTQDRSGKLPNFVPLHALIFI